MFSRQTTVRKCPGVEGLNWIPALFFPSGVIQMA